MQPLAANQPSEETRPGEVLCAHIGGAEGLGAVVQSGQIPVIHIVGALSRSGTGILGRFRQGVYPMIVNAAREIVASSVKVAAVKVDSFGGSMAGLDDPVGALLDLRKVLEGRGGALWSLCVGAAASAAYPLLGAASRGKVMATAATEIGGLGTRIRLEDTERLFEEGMFTTVHERTGDQTLKSTGAPGWAITPEMLEAVDARQRDAAATFFQLGAIVRGISGAEMAAMADKGQIFTAEMAKAIGLIDEVVDESTFDRLIQGDPMSQPTVGSPVASGVAPDVEATAQPDATAPANEAQNLLQKLGAMIPGRGAHAPAVVPPTPEPIVPPPADAAAEGAASTSLDVDALSALVSAQATQLTSTNEQMARMMALVEAQAADRQTAQMDAFAARIDAMVPVTSLSSAAAGGVKKTVEAMLLAQPEEAEDIVAGLERLPRVCDQVSLSEEITFETGEGGQQTTQVDFRTYGVVQTSTGDFAPADSEAAKRLATARAAKGLDPASEMRMLKQEFADNGGRW